MIRDRRVFHQTAQELQRRSKKSAVLISVTLEHPLFHSFYDITEYSDGGKCCPPITLLLGIEWYGRLVAVSAPSLKYVYQCPCVANKLFLNVLVYGLIQPGSLGRQYVINR